jgi:hypothetical protein
MINKRLLIKTCSLIMKSSFMMIKALLELTLRGKAKF